MSGQGSTSSSWKLWAVIGGLVALPVCLCAFCVISGLGATLLGTVGLVGLIAGEVRPAQEAAEQFLSALRDERWEDAYARCAPSLQRQLGGPEELARRYRGDHRPAEWSFSNWSVEVKNGVRQATLGGTLTTAGGEKFAFSMELRTRTVGSGEVWEVSAFRTD
ncbi:hypothetical protein [Thermoflexus hugenholtzii]|uniref:DUF4878 domain-containing protein n=1 Tax=Thermoflexus hugenholtzii JAD2 TaxID=877466 RepID=A0A212QQP9_9CHLR|nr:hypothetical protein [Thermoflexus hugenholtzii]SNB61813.1 hypothetical protein SAMN02746019_00004410 [Thermoflexus hugenholtzii JAD2]